MKIHPPESAEPIVKIENYGNATSVSVFGLNISRGCTGVKLDHSYPGSPALTMTVYLHLLERNIREIDEGQLDELCGNIRKFWLESNARKALEEKPINNTCPMEKTDEIHST